MNFRLVFCVAMGVFTTFIGFVMLLGHFRAQPDFELPPKPNFSAVVEEAVDEGTGEAVTHREFTVTTKLTERPAVEE